MQQIVNIMKYFVRSVKTFFYYIILLAVILAVLRLLKLTGGGVDEMFRSGWNSVWMILGLFAVMAGVYPMLGFKKYGIVIPGEYSRIRDGVVELMQGRGYDLEKEEGENMTFRLHNPFGRLTRMMEDRISFERDAHGFYVEGPNKDVVRIKSALEYKFREE